MSQDRDRSLADATGERVFIVPRRDCYHTYRECQGLNSAQKVIEAPITDIGEMPLCEFCSGEYTPLASSPSHNLRTLLDDLDPDDIG